MTTPYKVTLTTMHYSVFRNSYICIYIYTMNVITNNNIPLKTYMLSRIYDTQDLQHIPRRVVW